MSLQGYAGNLHSQNGEDGIIAEILDRIAAHGPLTAWCVEFGAWDGIHLSNTYALIRGRGYRAVLIEADAAKFAQLTSNVDPEQVIALHAFVGLDGPQRLDSILSTTPIPRDFDVLSIDIDGCDYWILDSLIDYAPKLIVVEFNPMIPNAVSYVQPRDFSVRHGSSARAITDLGVSKGYLLAAATDCNLILVRAEFIPQVLPDGPVGLAQVRDDSDVVTYAFSGYDGTVLLSRDLPLPWHDIVVPFDRLQLVPRLFRGFPGEWGRTRSRAWRAYRRLRGSA